MGDRLSHLGIQLSGVAGCRGSLILLGSTPQHVVVSAFGRALTLAGSIVDVIVDLAALTVLVA